MNRAPRKTTTKGERRELNLELLLADVGLLGFPIQKIVPYQQVFLRSTKISDYPLPHCRQTWCGKDFRHPKFIMADIPGIIEGAPKAGLGLHP